MSRGEDTVVPILPEPEDQGLDHDETVIGRASPVEGFMWNEAMAGMSPLSSVPPANVDVDSDEQGAKFRRRLVRHLSSQIKSLNSLDVFMAKADRYPRFVWQDFLLSFKAFQETSIDRDMDTGRSYGFQKLSHIIESYPDILQRELLRDSFQLEIETQKRRMENKNQRNDMIEIRERYGVLHAAVLLNRTELVELVRDPNTCRRKIRTILTPAKGVPNRSSFNLIRRAILWRHMHTINAPYAKVALLMKNFNKALKDHLKDPRNGALGTLIDQSAQDIDVGSNTDPWIILLAWSTTTEKHHHILEEFKSKKKQLFRSILSSLKKSHSQLARCLLETLTHKTQHRHSPLDSLMEQLILEPGPRTSAQSNIMNRFFLDRMSEQTPKSRWSPLHLAAARGDEEMVKILIKSCDTALASLGDGDQDLGKMYTTQLQQSFYDSKDMTPLHYAVLGNYKHVAECLIEWKIFQHYVSEKDIFQRTALQMACSLQERATIVKQLVKCTKIDVDTKDCCSFSALHWAVYSESTDAVKSLIFPGESANMIRTTEIDDEGRHPFELAAILRKPSKKIIQQLLLNSPPVKDEVERLYRDRQVYVDAANAILVGAALIASVSFGGWLQPHLGEHEGSTDERLRIFWAFSSLSFFFAIATVMAGATAVLPGRDEYIKDAVDSIRRWLAITAFLLILAVTCVLGAFAGGGYASSPLVPDLISNITITTIIGSVVCGIVGLFFCYKLFKVHPDWNHLFKDKRRSLGEKKAGWKYLLLQVWEHQLSPSISEIEDHSTFDGYGPENFEIWKTVLEEFLPKLSNREEFSKKMHPQDHGSCKRCLIRECHSQLDSFCLREAMNCHGIQTEASLQEYVMMWRDLSSAPLFKGIKLTEKMRKVVKEIVQLNSSSDSE